MPLRDLRALARSIVRHATRHGALTPAEAELLTGRFDDQNVSDTCTSSYTKDKRWLFIHAAGKDRAQVVLETAHLLAHLAHDGYGHTAAFWDIRTRLLHALSTLEPPMDLDTARRIVAARRIQRAWRRCIADPSYAACRARLMREWAMSVSMSGAPLNRAECGANAFAPRR